MKHLALIALLVVLAFAGAAAVTTASARSASTVTRWRWYTDELNVSNYIEAHGIGKVAIDTASCTGLRRYGVRTSDFGLDRFWHFKCDLIAANGHVYTGSVITTQTAKYYTYSYRGFRLEY